MCRKRAQPGSIPYATQLPTCTVKTLLKSTLYLFLLYRRRQESLEKDRERDQFYARSHNNYKEGRPSEVLVISPSLLVQPFYDVRLHYLDT